MVGLSLRSPPLELGTWSCDLEDTVSREQSRKRKLTRQHCPTLSSFTCCQLKILLLFEQFEDLVLYMCGACQRVPLRYTNVPEQAGKETQERPRMCRCVAETQRFHASVARTLLCESRGQGICKHVGRWETVSACHQKGQSSKQPRRQR